MKKIRVILEPPSSFGEIFSKIQRKTNFSAYFWNKFSKNINSQGMFHGRKTELLLDKKPTSALRPQSQCYNTPVLAFFS